MVDLVFLPQKFGLVVGPTIDICHSVNIDGVVNLC